MLAALGAEPGHPVQTEGEGGGEAEEEGGHQQPVQPLHPELTLTSLLQGEKCAEIFPIHIHDLSFWLEMIHLMPERKKNMGMFQAFMLKMNQSAARCHSGTLVAQPSLLGSVSGMILT